MQTPLKVIITGSTGMVGEGVLLVALNHPDVEKVLVINRRPCGISHLKLTEIIQEDFYHLSAIGPQLTGYNACFFCLGISSVGVKKDDYYQTTYVLTMNVAQTVSKLNPDMTFCYISGAGTSEKSRQNWSQVKAKTEHDLRKLPFKAAFGMRPGFIRPLPGQKNVQSIYKYIGWLFPVGRRLFPGGFCTVREIALSMIRISENGFPKPVLEGKDIIAVAKAI